MLANQHRLPVGETSIVGSVIHTRAPHIALDVGEDAVHFKNPLLPQTRSEIALPLIVGEKLWGALDVQSTQAMAFTDEDIAALQILADQVAIAIENASLFAQNKSTLIELQSALEASQRAYSQLSKEAWKKWLRSRPRLGYLCKANATPSRASASAQPGLPQQTGWVEPAAANEADLIQPAPEAWDASLLQAEELGGVVHLDDKTVALPLKIREQVLGAIRLRKPPASGDWSKQDLALLQTISDQLGAALESARLYEETHRRAERERLTGEITAKIRSTNDPKAILETAARELRNALQADRAQLSLKEHPASLLMVEAREDNGNGHPSL